MAGKIFYAPKAVISRFEGSDLEVVGGVSLKLYAVP